MIDDTIDINTMIEKMSSDNIPIVNPMVAQIICIVPRVFNPIP